MMSAIPTSDPPEIAATDALPAALILVMRRCLEKDPRDRFQSALDVGFVLETVTGASSGVSPTVHAPLRRSRRVTAMTLGALACG